MIITERLRRDFHNDALANLKTVGSLVVASRAPGRTVKLICHIVGSQSVWLSRLGREDSPLEVWPTLTLLQCDQHLRRLAAVWRGLLDDLDPAWLDHTISYRNTTGTVFHNQVADVMSHVLLHSAYHRGQIAMLLRDAGEVPVSTDLIAAARTGQLDGPLPQSIPGGK